MFCLANIFVQASVNGFGETAIAGSTVAMNFEYFTYYVIAAFGQTATTFTGQNHAAGQKERCKKILWLCLLLSTVCSSVLIFTIVLFRDFFSGLFTHDRAVVESAAVRIMCILLFEPICNLYEIPAGVLRGSGHALYPAAGHRYRHLRIQNHLDTYRISSKPHAPHAVSCVSAILGRNNFAC